MKKIASLLALCLFMASTSFATVRRVGLNTNLAIAGTDYTTVAAAIAAATDGDTILLFPTSTSNSINLTKRLVFIGTGYFTQGANSNDSLQILEPNNNLSVNFSTGSSRSRFIGINGLTTTRSINSTCDSIVIERCNMNGFIALGAANTSTTGWVIARCYNVFASSAANQTVNNLVVRNCLLRSLVISGTGNGLVENCVVATGSSGLSLQNGNFVVQNCAIINHPFVSQNPNSIFTNNYFSGSTTGFTGIGNTANYNFSSGDFFAGFPTSTGFSEDGQWKLKAGSPGIGAGTAGADIGMFGGVAPYRLSGIPPIPTFFRLSAPTILATQNPFTITFSVRGNN